jgi:phosphoglycolate phosphatase
MDRTTNKNVFSNVKAVIFDFDGTLAVLNIDFSVMREQVFDLIRRFGVKEESIRQKHALEIIDEVSAILFQGNPSAAQNFYDSAHNLLHEIEMEAAAAGRLLPRVEQTLAGLREKGIKVGIVT